MRRTIFSLGRLTLLLATVATGATPTSAPSPGRHVSWEEYRVILDRNIFARDRMAPSSEPSDFNRLPSRDAEHELVLTGVAVRGDVPLAFFEDSRTGEMVKAVPGQELAGGTLVAISWNGLEYRSEDTIRRIFVGENLVGQSGTFRSRSAASQPAAAAGTADKSSQTTDKEAAGVLERMRQRRLQELGP